MSLPRTRGRRFRRRFVAGVALVVLIAVLARRAPGAEPAPPTWLSIESVPAQACVPGEAGAAGASPVGGSEAVLSVREVRLAGDRRLDLKSVTLPPGWERSGEGGELRQVSACAPPLETEVASDWVGVQLAGLAQAAWLRFGTESRWVEPPAESSSPIEVELGARTAAHRWKEPRWVHDRRSLAKGPAVVKAAGRSHRVRFDELYEIEPSVGLPAKAVDLPVELDLPDVQIPREALLRLGLVNDGEGERDIRLQVRAPNAASRIDAAKAATAAPSAAEPTWIELPLGTRDDLRTDLRISLSAADGAAARVRLVDPSLRGLVPVGPPRARKPNVVLLTLDTVRADHLSVYGYDRPTTPFLEESARELWIFDDAYSQVPSTRPSHFSLFSSRYARDLGIWSNGDPPLPQSELTLAEVLRSAGWRTGAVLSVTFLGQDGGVRQGFDEFFMPTQKVQAQLGEETTESALDFIARNADRPFFLWIHYFDAHLPYQTLPRYQELFWNGPPPADADIEPDLIEKEGFGTLHALPHREYMTALYDASLRYLDDQIRALFTFLEERDLLDDTIVVIAADHGESLGEHGVYFAHDGLHEPNVRVPLLLRVPGASRTGRVDAIVENLDIAPTILDLAGLESPKEFRGSTLLASSPGDGQALFEHTGQWFTGIRRGPLKWIDARRFRANDRFAHSSLRELHEGPDVELFDLETDPSESTNLASQRAEEAGRLAEDVREWSAAGGEAGRRAEPRPADPVLRERLRALGYAQ